MELNQGKTGLHLIGAWRGMAEEISRTWNSVRALTQSPFFHKVGNQPVIKSF